MVAAHGVRLTGPLAPHADALWRALLAGGYSADSSRNLLRVVAHFSRWAQRMRLELTRLRRADVERFFATRRRAGYTNAVGSGALDAAFGPLEAAGVLAWCHPKAPVPTAIERLIGEYASYLSTERGLCQGTIRQYCDLGRRFLGTRQGARGLTLRRLRAEDVADFIMQEKQRFSTAAAKHAVTALRSLLRFLFAHGDMPHDLTAAVPAVAGWRLSWLPKALDAAQVARLLRACTRKTPEGRRAYAAILLMTRLGLRAGEVAALKLDDVDWRRGELVIRGKGRRHDRLPLPRDVGAALARYLADRPATAVGRGVFTRRRAPHRGLSAAGIKQVINAHFAKAGLSVSGAHRLRHTAATEMLRRGGSLDEIAQVLRHKSHDTTAIYAKVDLVALRRVVRRWPGGAQ